MKRQGIPTVYRGIEFRSRVEARWAAMFTNLGWSWEYEPVDADGYIPDFLVQGGKPMFVEVKAAISHQDYMDATPKAEALVPYGTDVLIVGASPFPLMPGGFNNEPDYTPAGVLGEHHDSGILCWSSGNWIVCRNCNRVSVFHSLNSFQGRPCGCYDGDHFLGHPPIEAIRTAWNRATNDVKWRGRAI